jgi:hypothetical protein
MAVLEMVENEMKADAVALVHFVRYSEELCASACRELWSNFCGWHASSSRTQSGREAWRSAYTAKAMRENDRQTRGIGGIGKHTI